ncbi:MAG TPA: BON domain-containing protein [Candidatus Binataceae bacterium]
MPLDRWKDAGYGFRLLIAIGLLAAVGMIARPAPAQQENPQVQQGAEPGNTTSSSISKEHETVSTEGKHHYNSPAERAQDDLLITEVKSALNGAGIVEGHAVEVDCDHGTVLLTGAVGSAADAQHAAQLASGVQGVVGVTNRLTWQ